MNNRYADILDIIPDEPKWWDEHAVPRYCDFSPRENANIYADEVVLMLIQCQDCEKEYKVCLSLSTMGRFNRADPEKPYPSLAERIETREIHYGDPPNNCGEGCCAGATMSSVPVRVLEFWRRPEKGCNKERVPELERDVWPDWMTDEDDAV